MNARRLPTLLTAAMLALFCGAGCRSTPEKPHVKSDSLAAIEVHAREPFDVARAISEVFRSAGYMPLPLDPNDDLRLAFEKESTIADTVLFGGFNGKTWERARLRIESIQAGTQIIHCNGFRVIDHGDRFEEETKTSARRGTYNDLLKRVKASLDSPAK